MEPFRDTPAAPAQTGQTFRHWARGHRRGLTVALVLLAALAVAARAGVLFSDTKQLKNGFQPSSGHSYVATLEQLSFFPGAVLFIRSDTVERPTQSGLQL